MPDTSRLFMLSLLALATGTSFVLLGASGGAGAILTGPQWVELVTWLIGLQAGGAAGFKLGPSRRGRRWRRGRRVGKLRRSTAKRDDAEALARRYAGTVEPKTDLERLAELAQIWRKLARLHGADPDGPWGALLSPVASEAWGLARRLGVSPELVLGEAGEG